MTDNMTLGDPASLDAYPELKAHTERVKALPGIKEWIESRPESTF